MKPLASLSMAMATCFGTPVLFFSASVAQQLFLQSAGRRISCFFCIVVDCSSVGLGPDLGKQGSFSFRFVD